jgi:hypothetical protein
MTSVDFDTLEQEVEAFCQFIESLPPKALLEQSWGPKEVLAHLLFYHELYVSQTRAVLSGQPLELLTARYRDLNAQVAESSRGVPVQELLFRLRAANCQLGELVAGCDPVQVVLPIKKGVKPYPLTVLIPEVTSHIRNHRRQLQKAKLVV